MSYQGCKICTAAHGADHGSGRGQGFLRSRAREAGGTLTSGPTAEGGWEVRAVLPGRTAAASVEPSVPLKYRLAQVTAAAGLALQPLLPSLIIHSHSVPSGQGVSAGVLFALLAAAQSLALLWMRRAPGTAQGVLFGTALLWPVAMVMGRYTGWVLLPPLLSMVATCAAVASAAARTAAALASGTEDRPRLRPWAVPVAAVVVHAAATTAAVVHRGTSVPVWAAAAGVTAQTALVVGASWWGGHLYGCRARVARSAHARNVASWTEEAVRDAWAERQRIATGLETTVLARTANMVTQAEAGRLEAAAERAREALSAMRALLDAVRDAEAAPTLRPQPTLQALDLLTHQLRATGREVGIRLTGRVPVHLPTAVDLAAYHACEAVLSAGGNEPMVVDLDADDEALTLTATGVPDTARAALRRQLAARAAVLGGALVPGPPGTVSLRLPLAGDTDRVAG